MIEYVCGFAFSGDFNQDVVLIRKNKPDWQKGKLNGVGGHVEEGEDYYQAMVREFEEETGLKVPSWEHFLTLEGKTFRVAFFRAFNVDVADLDSKTEELVLLYPSKKLASNVLPNVRWLVPLALDPEPLVPNIIRYGS